MNSGIQSTDQWIQQNQLRWAAEDTARNTAQIRDLLQEQSEKSHYNNLHPHLQEKEKETSNAQVFIRLDTQPAVGNSTDDWSLSVFGLVLLVALLVAGICSRK